MMGILKEGNPRRYVRAFCQISTVSTNARRRAREPTRGGRHTHAGRPPPTRNRNTTNTKRGPTTWTNDTNAHAARPTPAQHGARPNNMGGAKPQRTRNSQIQRRNPDRDQLQILGPLRRRATVLTGAPSRPRVQVNADGNCLAYRAAPR